MTSNSIEIPWAKHAAAALAAAAGMGPWVAGHGQGTTAPASAPAVAAAVSVPVAVLAWVPGSIPLLTFGIVIAALVAWAHRGNLARIRAGTEPRAEKLWLLRPRKAPR